MRLLQFVKRDWRFYRRGNWTVVGLAGLCCAILTGSLLVGDSVRFSLRRLSSLRLGKVQLAMESKDRFFRQTLAGQCAQLTGAPAAAALMQKGILESADGKVRINDIVIYGIDGRFFELADNRPQSQADPAAENFWIGRSVMDRLGDKRDDLLLRFDKDLPFSRELIFSKETTASAWPIPAVTVLEDDSFGRFGLTPQQQAPLNVFVPIAWLAQKIAVPDKANILLLGKARNGQNDLEQINKSLHGLLDLDDLQLELRSIDSAGVIELASPRIFIEEPAARAAAGAGAGAYGVFTYLVNEIKAGEKSVPYSMVSAIASPGAIDRSTNLDGKDIVINEWLADELKADIGNPLTLTYYRAAAGTELREETAAFTVKNIVPMMGSFADPTLMPSFPGLSNAQSCRQWDSGVPIDLSLITSRDEAYWDRYKGTPKAFISMQAAHRIWANRFGAVTAVRWPAASNNIDSIKTELVRRIDPAEMGFVFRDVAAAAKSQSKGSSDFADLFAGLSAFLIASAAVILALVFMFYIEKRMPQAGLLMAVGWGRTRVGSLFLAEGAAFAMIGCIFGAIASMAYTKTFISIMNSTYWSRAVASLPLRFHADPLTLVKGAALSFLVCTLALLAGLLSRIRQPSHQLLTGATEFERSSKPGRIKMLTGSTALFLTAGLIVPFAAESISMQTKFFLAAVLLLAGMICGSVLILNVIPWRRGSVNKSLARLAVKNIGRNRGRSIAVLITAACGVFLVLSVGANYKDVSADARNRHSGTGGFALIAQSTLPLTAKPVLAADQALRMPAIEPAAVIALKLFEREDASCLNLNRAVQPSILGVNAAELAARDAFSFQSAIERTDSGWKLLASEPGDVVPVIGDYATVYWMLGKKAGDTLEYEAENGPVTLRIAGLLKDSMLQGKLIMAEDSFDRLFPSAEGYRVFLIDADWGSRDLQAQQLSKRYRDKGMDVSGAAQRLAAFHEVENTYLAIFLALGGLGLLLGSAALGFILLLNVQDRRGELAMMVAVGFRRQDLQFILCVEHGVILALGILCGLLPALYAVMPALWMQGRAFPAAPAVLLVLGMSASGAVWIWLAVRTVLRMNFLDALKNQ
ncbi:MAG: ABC transporter permease [Planctomycetaceae bacterium]|nr:ABC transporter permease [Planctomycetaceae bacterium]